MDGKDISNEIWREYDYVDLNDRRHIYRITAPATLYLGTTTHRVVDRSGVAHVVPGVGQLGCVLRFQQFYGGVSF
jgi:hypothetical protein